MIPIRLLLAPRAASATLLAASQSPGAAALTLTSTASQVGGIDPQAGTQWGLGHIITITSGGNDTGITFAIVGQDLNGQTMTDTVTGASSGTAVSALYFTSITSITPSSAAASTVTVGIRGTTASAALNVIPLDFYNSLGVTVAVDVSGTISYTVQETFSDCMNPVTASLVGYATPASPTALTAQSASKYTQLSAGVCGVLVTIPTYSTGGTITVNIISACYSDNG